MPKFFIDLAVPGAVDRVFTYSVPQHLRDLARPGVRALAPFGRKTVSGIIVATSGESGVPGIRDILDIIDERPLLDDGLMKLAGWISSYYHAPIGEVLRAMLVAGSTGVGKTAARAAVEVTPALLASLSRAPLQQSVMRRLAGGATVASATLRKGTGAGSVSQALHELRRKGYVAVEELAPTGGASAKTESTVVIDADAVDGWRKWLNLNEGNRRIAKQSAVLRALAGTGPGEVAAAGLIRSHGLSPSALSALVKKGVVRLTRREVVRDGSAGTEHREEQREFSLNAHQSAALAALLESVEAGTFGAYLLWGITGSGKTQVYIEAIARALELGRTALVLVPEISLTPQTVGRFRRRFGDRVVMFHSRMSRGERYDAWRLAREGRYSIVIGPRSAVFAPLPRLGLLVVDEEHEPSYKQFDQSPRYHARDAAVVRGKIEGAAVVLGSATPSIESFHNALSGKYRLLGLPERADGARLPAVTIVDMAAERKMKFEAYRASRKEQFRTDPIAASVPLKKFEPGSLSDLLRERIADRLPKKEGVIILQNRRGFSAYLECRECGRVEMCDRCQISLTYHRTQRHLRCHYCGFVKTPPLFCGECGAGDLRYYGIGTQRVEEELRAAFPAAAVGRMDLDTTARKGSHAEILNRFASGEIDILLGTQMIAKGLDIPRVTLVGVVSADTQLLLPDFRSAERTFQLLTQVAGRSGRRKIPGEVIVQTMQPRHPTMLDVARHDYRKFYDDEIRYRKDLGYPPFTRITLLEFTGAKEEEVRHAAGEAAAALRKRGVPGTLMGPSPAAIVRIRDRFRWHIVIKTPRESDPSGALITGRLAEAILPRRGSVRMTIDADPQSLM
jgi:primosomal protein N' (replication factor Y)